MRPFLEAPRQSSRGAFSIFPFSPPLALSPTHSPPGIYRLGKNKALTAGSFPWVPTGKISFQQSKRKDEENRNIGVDHGYYAVKTRHFSFPAGITAYRYEPYTLQNTLEYQGKYYVCGTGRQPILRNKMENDNYYLLTLAAIAKEIQQRGEKRECAVNLSAGLPLAGFGREKKVFREYLFRSSQPVSFKFEGIPNTSTCRSLELGMVRCVDEAKEQVRRETGLSVTNARVERVLAGQNCSMDENARTIIQKQGRIYTEVLLSAAMEAGFDLKAVPAVMLGGGASVIQRGIRTQDGLRRFFTLLDDKVNAEGFERILGQLSGGVSKK